MKTIFWMVLLAYLTPPSAWALGPIIEQKPYRCAATNTVDGNVTFANCTAYTLKDLTTRLQKSGAVPTVSGVCRFQGGAWTRGNLSTYWNGTAWKYRFTPKLSCDQGVDVANTRNDDTLVQIGPRWRPTTTGPKIVMTDTDPGVDRALYKATDVTTNGANFFKTVTLPGTTDTFPQLVSNRVPTNCYKSVSALGEPRSPVPCVQGGDGDGILGANFCELRDMQPTATTTHNTWHTLKTATGANANHVGPWWVVYTAAYRGSPTLCLGGIQATKLDATDDTGVPYIKHIDNATKWLSAANPDYYTVVNCYRSGTNNAPGTRTRCKEPDAGEPPQLNLNGPTGQDDAYGIYAGCTRTAAWGVQTPYSCTPRLFALPASGFGAENPAGSKIYTTNGDCWESVGCLNANLTTSPNHLVQYGVEDEDGTRRAQVQGGCYSVRKRTPAATL